eukprot:591560-Pyramimonas_sp.AAC.1
MIANTAAPNLGASTLHASFKARAHEPKEESKQTQPMPRTMESQWPLPHEYVHASPGQKNQKPLRQAPRAA